MSAPQNPNHEEEVEVKELTNEDYEKIVKDVLSNEKYKAEARYFLELEEVTDFGGGYDYAEFNIIKGKAEVVQLEKYEAFNEVHRKYLIIPLSVPVVILYREGGANYDAEILYVFTKDGWKEVTIY